MTFEAQRLRLVREPELFSDRPEDELREVFVPDVLDLDDPLPSDDRFAADLAEPVEREDDRELTLPLLADFAPPLFLEDEPDVFRFEEEPDEPLFVDEFFEDLLLLERDEPPDDAELLPLMLPVSAVCTTFAAPSTAPIAALVKSVPAASAAFDNKPLDLRLLLLDF